MISWLSEILFLGQLSVLRHAMEMKMASEMCQVSLCFDVFAAILSEADSTCPPRRAAVIKPNKAAARQPIGHRNTWHHREGLKTTVKLFNCTSAK